MITYSAQYMLHESAQNEYPCSRLFPISIHNISNTLYSVHCKQHTGRMDRNLGANAECTVSNAQWTVYSAQCTVYTVCSIKTHFTFITDCTLQNAHYTLWIDHSVLHKATLYIKHLPLQIVHSTLSIAQSTLYITDSTLLWWMGH